MTLRLAIISVLQLLTVLFFGLGGIFFFSLFYLTEVRYHFAALLWDDPETSLWIGIAFFSATFLFALGFYHLGRKKMLRLRLGGQLTTVHMDVIRHTLDLYFKKSIPQAALIDVGMQTKQKLVIHLQSLKKEARIPYQQIEKELQALLMNRFGLSQPFELFISE